MVPSFHKMQRLARPMSSIQKHIGYEIVASTTPGIMEIVEFTWYKHMWYFDKHASFPINKRKIGRWLGDSHCTGQVLTYYIVNEKVVVISCSTVHPMSCKEPEDQHVKDRIKELDKIIKSKYEGGYDWKDSPDKQIPLLFDQDDDMEAKEHPSSLD